jgi:hypothetical protein
MKRIHWRIVSFENKKKRGGPRQITRDQEHSRFNRINPHEAKENIHLRPTSISRTLFRFVSFSGTSVSLSKSRDTGAAQKKELASPIQRATMLDITIGAAAPIGAVLYHHAYIGPVLVIPPRLFRGRDHLFTIFTTVLPLPRAYCTRNSSSQNSLFHYSHNSRCP